MFLDYAWLPPEINSARIFGGVGSGPLAAAGSAWEALAADLRTSAAAFESVITGLASGPWAGPSAVSMAAAATPYIGWLSAAAAQAEAAASQAQAAATAFETALVATVHPGAVSANRVSLVSLVATNFLGQNAPAIAATEFDYVEMWAQDVGAMVGYESGAQSVAAALVPFSVPPLDLAGLVSTASAGVAGIADGVTAAVSPVVEGALVAGSGVVAGVQSLASALPLQSVISVAQAAATPASMLIGPLMQAGQSASANTAALAGATAADVPKFVGDTAPAVGGLGGGGGLGAGTSAGLGQARLVGAMSVPSTWPGSTPAAMGSSAVRGLGAVNAAEMAQAAAAAPTTGGGMPMMPMPMGAGAGAGAGMPAGMMGGRGGANPHVVQQQRPSVVPRTGI